MIRGLLRTAEIELRAPRHADGTELRRVVRGARAAGRYQAARSLLPTRGVSARA